MKQPRAKELLTESFCLRLTPDDLSALHAIAYAEERSIADSTRRLLRDAITQRGAA